MRRDQKPTPPSPAPGIDGAAPATQAPAAGAPARSRRRLLGLASAIALVPGATTGAPALAAALRVLPGMTDGPFYPSRRWRDAGPFAAGGWDADLTRVATHAAPARGEHLALALQVVDRDGRVVDGAEVEIWQCDALAAYRHPRQPADEGGFDPGFQGFGAATTAGDGLVRLRTIRPVPYPGRTPHIHVKLRHASFGEVGSQLFVDGDPGNAGDFLWRRLDEEARRALAMRLQPAPADAPAGLRWQAQHRLVVPA
ncbi:MAG: intradiol ring-cleavage dioxygenase [Burkholderiales bacterium]|nr:intradiol ring-cleavage dioxygenase [Burkholderiales bacterium]